MRPRGFRTTSTHRSAGVRDATSLEETVRAVRTINWRVKHERSLASTAAREAHLRSLMGLPATPTLRNREDVE
jgi:hypothetical protein